MSGASEPRYALHVMKLEYEEFDLSGRDAISAGVAGEQGAARGLRAGPSARRRHRRLAARACRGCSPRGSWSPSSTRSPPLRLDRHRSSGASARTSSRPGSVAVLVDLMARGYVSALAMNGAGSSTTSRSRSPGRRPRMSTRRSGLAPSGWPRRPAPASITPSADGVARGWGLGRVVAEWLAAQAPAHAEVSLLCAAVRHGVPVTAHVAVGTDIIHMHPGCLGRGDRRGQPARLPPFRVVGGATGRRRLPELRVGRGAAGGVPEGGRRGAQSRARPRPD